MFLGQIWIFRHLPFTFNRQERTPIDAPMGWNTTADRRLFVFTYDTGRFMRQ
jgi:hypothetical protein